MLFGHLFKLAQHGPMVMSISVDAASGRMTVNVMPNVGKNPADAALRTPLTLTGTPEEFDAGFFKLLEGYRESRKSLAEQAEATREVIDAAKDAQVAKAAKASAAKTKASDTSAVAPKAVSPAATETQPADTSAGESHRESSDAGDDNLFS